MSFRTTYGTGILDEAPVDGHDCATLDRFERTHVDCAVCGNALLITKADDEGGWDFAAGVDADHCETCDEPVCENHLREGVCSTCIAKLLGAAQDADELFNTLRRAAIDLRAYSRLLDAETDPSRIRESVGNLHAVEDALSDIRQKILARIERATERVA